MGKPCDIHIVVNNRAGSVEHYYHFLLGLFVPVVNVVINVEKIAQVRCIYVRSCAVMDPLLAEIGCDKIVILRKDLHGLKKNERQDGVDLIELELDGLDGPRHYDHRLFNRATDYVKAKLAPAIARELQSIESSLATVGLATGGLATAGKKIAFIGRDAPDPYYLSKDAEITGSGNQRRSIANYTDAAQALGQRFTVHACAMEGSSLARQIAIFQWADIIIAQHGAGLANLIWARSGTGVIEILPPVAKEFPFRVLAEGFGIHYHKLEQQDAHGPVDIERLLQITHMI